MEFHEILEILQEAPTGDLDLLSTIWLRESDQFPELKYLIREKQKRLEWE
jgi:hypothetical protein